jgi:hypothetical protein
MLLIGGGVLMLCMQLFYVQGMQHEGLSVLRGKKPFLSVLTKVMQEDQYFEEWLQYHHRLGVDRFYIYDDAVSTKTEQLLRKYIDRGIVEYIPQHSEKGGHSLQGEMFEHWMAHYRHDTVWISQLDVDEFLHVDVEYQGSAMLLSTLLRSVDPSTVGMLFLQRTNFGTGGHTHQPTEGGVVSNYVWKARDRDGANKLMKKWIVSTQCIQRISSPHMVEMVGTQITRKKEESCQLLKPREISINHYGTKSTEEYLMKDVLRLRFTHVDEYDRLVRDGCADAAAAAALVDAGESVHAVPSRESKCRAAFEELQHKSGMTGALRDGFQNQPGGLFAPWDASRYVEDRGLLKKYGELMMGHGDSGSYSKQR